MNIFDLFKEKKIEEDITPKIGEIYRLKGEEGDPWDERACFVKILDIKQGWVRYHMSSIFPDLRKSIPDFLSIYTKVL